MHPDDIEEVDDGVDRSWASPEVEQDWTDFWERICTVNDALDLNQIKKELFDYHAMMRNTAQVFEHVTGGRVSKPNTSAQVVIILADEYSQETCAAEEAERRTEMQRLPDAIEQVKRDLMRDLETARTKKVWFDEFYHMDDRPLYSGKQLVEQAERSRMGAYTAAMDVVNGRLDTLIALLWAGS